MFNLEGMDVRVTVIGKDSPFLRFNSSIGMRFSFNAVSKAGRYSLSFNAIPFLGMTCLILAAILY